MSVDDRAELFRLGCPQGEYGLRSAISSYLHQARGVNCSPDQIIVGAGNDYLMMLLCAIIGTHHKVLWRIRPISRLTDCLKIFPVKCAL